MSHRCAVGKRPKSPGTSIPEYVDFLGQRILRGDDVIIGQRDGNHDRMWSAEVIDINIVEHQLYNQVYETKLLVQPTGAYRGSSHVWPMEKDLVTNEHVISGRPKMSWIDASKAVRSPVRVLTVLGQKKIEFTTEPQESA